MAQRIVDDLESVKIDEQHRKLPLIARRSFDCEMQQLVEHFAIWQVCQAVMRSEIFDSCVCLGLFVSAVEIVERKGNVLRQFGQKFDQIVGEQVFLAAKKQHDADGLAALPEQGE